MSFIALGLCMLGVIFLTIVSCICLGDDDGYIPGTVISVLLCGAVLCICAIVDSEHETVKKSKIDKIDLDQYTITEIKEDDEVKSIIYEDKETHVKYEFKVKED